jgi:hypothetical protein
MSSPRERWPSGRRRTPAKGVRVKSPSRVRIPLSPPTSNADRHPGSQRQTLRPTAGAFRFARDIPSRDAKRGRYWGFDYCFNNKRKALALGICPDASLAKARGRHQEARERFHIAELSPAVKRHFGGGSCCRRPLTPGLLVLVTLLRVTVGDSSARQAAVGVADTQCDFRSLRRRHHKLRALANACRPPLHDGLLPCIEANAFLAIRVHVAEETAFPASKAMPRHRHR